MPIEDIVTEIRQSLTRLISEPIFDEWLAEMRDRAATT
jgi:hypothetical protein